MRRAIGVIIGVVATAIVAVLGASTAQAAVRYDIYVKTCNVNNAGTDANVQGKLFGANGETGWVVLDLPIDDRERGHTDHYTFDLADVGPISAISLSYDHSGGSPDWCLDNVVIEGPHGVTTHPFHNWLTSATTITLVAF